MTLTPTSTPEDTATPTPSATLAPSETPTATSTATPSATHTPEPSETPTSTATATETPLPGGSGDFDTDGDVDTLDLLHLLDLIETGGSEGDLNGDGKIDYKDLFLFGKKYGEEPRLMDLVDSILVSVDRCGTITKRLLSFARSGGMEIKPIDLGEVIFEVLGFLGKEADYRSIHIEMKVDDDIPRFESDRGKLQQIFLNIINNAFAAMDDGGRLNIKARRTGVGEILVRITDTGCGIPPEDLDRIFEPFFSTRDKQGGTGLGLAITYSIIRELGGKIAVESEVGKGTTFLVTLPLEYPKGHGRE